ncbi:tyrosine-type recombinase/integrase [Halomonas sp. LBP4]|uniref:tyrosine-type recombinase/integrase n=1 Tax=Halomonas sp. LBP4 TaxID=2044917 RepID=UPI000D772970|nr:site-specific integrase [Halomonas sp. LBP4]PXX95900.1 hypothetical protein CR157_17010 [Halomonas sp. LBP4]
MDDDHHVIPAASHSPSSVPTTAVHITHGHRVVDYDEIPIRISPVPLPRGKNPAFRHLRAQAAQTSRVSKRSQLNRVALMLGAPKPPKLSLDGDSRKVHPEQLFPMDYVHWEDLTQDIVSDIIFNLQRKAEAERDKDLSPATRNTYRALLRGVAQEAWGLKQMAYEDVERIRSVKALKYKRLPGGRAHPEQVIRALLDVCDSVDSALHCRDGLMVALLASTGMRRAELVGVQIEDIDERTREVKITGKGNKDRVLEIPASVWDRLADYLDRYRGHQPGALFTPIWNNRDTPRITKKGLSESTINLRLDTIREKAGNLIGVSIAPHDLRRTFATDLYNSGMTIREIQILLGHASAITTETYLFDESSEYRKKAAKINANRFGKSTGMRGEP